MMDKPETISLGVPDWLLVVQKMILEDVIQIQLSNAAQAHHMAVWMEISPMIRNAKEQAKQKGQS